jgi:hypothetical protein
MKFWFFVEGESELALARHIIRTVHFGSIEEKSLVRFVNDPVGDKVIFNCFDCNSVDNIPYRLSEQLSNIIKSQAVVVVLCDVEKLGCCTNRRAEVLKKFDADRRGDVRCVFAKPLIEAIYWNYPDVIKSTMKKLAQYNKLSIPEVEIPKVEKNYKGALSDLCKKYGLRYREGEFAEHFFGSVGNRIENSAELKRLQDLLKLTGT